MPNISSYTFPQMTDLVKRSFQDGLETLPQVMRTSGLVVEEAMPQHTWEFKRFAERLQRNQYASVRDEWDISKMAKVQYGYEKDLQVYTVSLEVSITKRMRVAGKNQEILDQITSLSEVCPATMDLDLTHRLTFAFASSYVSRDGITIDTTVGDGNPLIYNAHTLTGSSTTYSNAIASNPAFSKAALENAENLFVTATFNNLGEKMAMKPDVIVTTDDPNTCNQVRELLKSTASVADYNNSGVMNVYKEKYRHIVLPRLATTANGAVDTDKKKYWFLASTKDSDFYLSILEAPYLKTPADWNNGEEFSSENWKYLTAATYGIAIVTGRWIKGSTWAGA